MPARAVRACFASAGVLALAATLASAASAKTFYIAKNGNNANPCTSTKPCKTINRGVGLAKRGDTVVVSKGSYSQNVLITKDIKVTGVGNPVINALGRDNGFVVQGAGAAGATVSGFTVENAAFEGILVEKTSRVTISGNLVKNNDQGHKAAKPTGECAPAGQIPGDCGEGIHLITVSHAKVTGNTVTGNAGGIYLTDEFGPTSHNLVSHNRSLNNLLDCGITVAGHSNKAVSLLTGKPTPTTGGVFANTVIDNVVNNNGTKEAGAGILMAGGAPGTGVYDNLVEGNSASGNGHAGVVIHSHAPLQDMNGNRIIDNKLSHNGALGDPEFGEQGTVDILVASAVTKLTGIVIKGNFLSDAHYGIYTKNAPPLKKSDNSYKNVTVPVKQI